MNANIENLLKQAARIQAQVVKNNEAFANATKAQRDAINESNTALRADERLVLNSIYAAMAA